MGVAKQTDSLISCIENVNVIVGHTFGFLLEHLGLVDYFLTT